MLIALVVIALGATDAVTYTSLRSYLFQQVDDTLSSISAVPGGAVENALLNPGNSELGLPNGTFAAIYDTDANGVLAEQLPATAGWTGGVPVVPVKKLERSLTSQGQSLDMTVTATSGTQFRLFAENVQALIHGQGGFSGLFVVAVPLNGVTGTAHRLLELELLVSCAVLIALAAAAWLTVRIGLRPLEQMAETAGAIAAGDLSQRVKQTDDRTEVGRLGSALNVMLARIETAFREREASEARLRRFVADASHELRTPLTSIRGYAELFQHGLVDRPADLDTAMRRIDSESIRMAGLVDDLLLLARLDQGRPLEQEPVDLAALAGDAVQDARASFSGISFRTPLPTHPLAARSRSSSPSWLRRALPLPKSGSLWSTMAPGSRRMRLHTSSSVSGGRTLPESVRTVAPDWGSRSWRPSRTPTAGTSRSSGLPAAAPPSASSSR